MNALQGYFLISSDRGGMRIEYAKNKMGEVTSQSVTVSVPNVNTNNKFRAAFYQVPPEISPSIY